MIRFTATPPEPHELEIAKSRLRIAAIQAAPGAMIARHPWGSVIGVFAGTFAVTGVLALANRFIPKKRDARSGDGVSEKSQRKTSSGFKLPAGLLQWAATMGMQLTQAYFTKRAAEQAQNNRTDRSQEQTHAVG